MSVVIRLQQLTKHYRELCAVDHLDLEVKRGEIYGFLGPNGSGKSTTLRMMMDLIRPSSGSIQLFGLPLSTHRSSIMPRIGCIIEKPDFYNYLSAAENIALFARARGLHPNKEEYRELFKMVGLQGRETHKVKTYSHGMKQRLGLAQALLHKPELLILDEPNTGLDPQGIIDLRQLMLQLNRERNMTVLFSSHILAEVQEVCSSIIVIHKGKTIAQGSVSELVSDADLHVEVEVQDGLYARQQLGGSAWENKLLPQPGRGDQYLLFNLSHREIPALVEELHIKRIPLLALGYRNRLEEYFLKITQQ